MGSWSVLSCQGAVTPLANPYGHDFRVVIRMQYTPSLIGKFVEPPILAWDEVILCNEYADGSWWSFSGNMYQHKPASPTVAVWGQRYFRAYLHAHGTPYTGFGGNAKGSSKLFTSAGAPVQGAALGVRSDFDKQNKAVQNYLKSHGGILEIELHDIPGISVGAGLAQDVERVLAFNCGVTGMGQRVQCWQHLKVNTAQPPTTWTRNFQMGGNPPGLRTTGLQKKTNYAEMPNTNPPEGSVD